MSKLSLRMAPTLSLHERILRAAERIFYQKGYVNARLDEIANEAGTSVSGIVRLFDTKYGVLAALYDRSWSAVNKSVAVAVEGCSCDPRERLVAIAVTLWLAYEASSETFYPIILNTGIADSLILSSSEQRIDSKENLRHVELVRKLCEECVNGGWVDGAYSCDALREGIYGIIEGVLVGWYQQDWSGSTDKLSGRISVEGGTMLIRVLLYGRLTAVG